MFLGKTKHPRKVESCGLVWTGDKDPFTLVSGLLKGKGVRIGKVDKNHSRITARMTPWDDSGLFKVTLKLFPQVDVCLVVATCEASHNGDEDALLDCVRKLKTCLDNVRLVDEKGVLEWKRRSSRSVPTYRHDAGAVAIALETKTGRA